MENQKNYIISESDIALWRFGIIGSLIHGNLSGTTLQENLEKIAKTEYIDPKNRLVRISPETLRKWLYRYNTGGLAALEDKERSDKGRTLVPEYLADRIRELRQQHLRWTLAIIFNELKKEKLWNGRLPSISALYRFAKASNLKRSGKNNAEACSAFAFDDFGQLWIADFLHGPKLRFGKEKKKVYLHAIIDDATRFIVSADFFISEGTEVLMSELKNAIRRHGLPMFFYTDNGSAYRSRCLKIVGARLKIGLPHSPPYKPRGRAKIERFFLTVREQFLDVHHFTSLEEIRKAFQIWLAEYHQRPHKGIGCSPLQKRMQVKSVCRTIPESTNIDPLFYMERRCKVQKDGIIQLKKRRYEVPKACLPGTRVIVYYDNQDLSKIFVGSDHIPAFPLNLAQNARRFEHPAHNFKKENSA
ncbi:MAG: DDE-type integrase/transposase/recombinase [Candidatus Riflebacteria bacterium]|nr:DDE-type integrase/transposase/recombinase [Candidatus Riflebacteria bacterium]